MEYKSLATDYVYPDNSVAPSDLFTELTELKKDLSITKRCLNIVQDNIEEYQSLANDYSGEGLRYQRLLVDEHVEAYRLELEVEELKKTIKKFQEDMKFLLTSRANII